MRVLLVCDGCRHYLHSGTRSSEPLRSGDFSQAMESLGEPDELLAAARAAGWCAEAEHPARWYCPECAQKRLRSVLACSSCSERPR